MREIGAPVLSRIEIFHMYFYERRLYSIPNVGGKGRGAGLPAERPT